MLETSTILRAARTAGIVASLLGATGAGAQDARSSTWELRVPSGALIATGVQREQVESADITAVQLSWLAQPRLAITGTFGWARSRDLATENSPRLNVFTSDLGLEVRSREWFAGAPVSLSAFAGLGAGARIYDYAKLDVEATSNLAGYASAGGEVGAGRVALRVEARNYATEFRPLVGAGKSDARNDVVIMAAVRFNRRSSGTR